MQKDKQKLLIVDDEVFYIDILVDLLAKRYSVSVAKMVSRRWTELKTATCPILFCLMWSCRIWMVMKCVVC